MKCGRRMIVAFKIVLLLIVIVSFLGTVGEKEDKNLRSNMTSICIASMHDHFPNYVNGVVSSQVSDTERLKRLDSIYIRRC